MSSTTTGFSGKSFQSAARRRGGTALSFELQIVVSDEQGNIVDPECDVVLTVDPQVDMIRLGAAIGGFGATLRTVDDKDIDPIAKLDKIDAEWPIVRQAFGRLLTAESALVWNEAQRSVDVNMLGAIIGWLNRELSPLDPMEPQSSPNGSLTTGAALMGGVLPEVSTSESSPSIEQ